VTTLTVDRGVNTTDLDKLAGKGYVEVDYLRSPDAQHKADWGYVLQRRLDPKTNEEIPVPTDTQVVIDRDHQHVERRQRRISRQPD